MFWLGRSIAEFQKLKEAISESQKEDFEMKIEWVIATIARAGLMMRYLFENYIILSKAKLFKPKDMAEVVRVCSKFWFIGVAGGFLANLIKLFKCQMALAAASPKEEGKLAQKRSDLLYTVAASFGDATSSANGSNFAQTVLGVSPTPLFISSFGMVGSAMQLTKNWRATK